jgi:hypothetical protein
MDNVDSARRWFDDIVNRARSDERWKAELLGDPDTTLREAGLSPGADPALVSTEVLRRAALEPEGRTLRSKLDKIADHARRDPQFRQRLLDATEVVLTEAGLNSPEASSLSLEMHGPPTPELRCQFTCCRHPATDWSCDPSVLV